MGCWVWAGSILQYAAVYIVCCILKYTRKLTVRLQAYTPLTCNAAAEALLLAKGGHELAALVDAQGNTAAHLKALKAQS